MKRGQVSIEYIMIIGLLLLVTIPLFVYAFVEVKRNVQMNHAEDAVSTLANAANTVYALGPGSKKYVWITTPGGITQTHVEGNEISMKMYIFGGESDVFASTKPTVIGSIPTGQGAHRVAVESLGSGVVRIGEAPADVEKPLITRMYPDLEPGEKLCQGLVTIGADTNEPATCKYVQDGDYIGKENWELWTDEFEGRALSHYLTEYHNEGIYSYYARCEDYEENFMDYELFDPTSETLPTVKTVNITFEIEHCEEGLIGICGPEDPEDYDLPVVTLEGPANWENRTYPLIEFNYTVTDETSSIDYCILNISKTTGTPPNYGVGDPYASAYDFDPIKTENPANKINNSIEFAFGDKGAFIWNVFCVDQSCMRNKGISEDRIINISKTFFEAFLTSCAGQCGLIDYIDGYCVSSGSSCKESNGEYYYPEFDQYCEIYQDPGRKACCCIK